MRRVFASVVLMAAIGSAEATGIPSYLTDIDAAAQGQSQVLLQLQFDDASAGALLIPLAPSLKPAGAVKLESAPLGTRVKTVTVGERPHLELVFPEGVEKAVPLTVSFPVKDLIVAPKTRARGKKTLPEDSLLLDHSFVNTQPITIGSYRVKVKLPAGARVHAVREESPKPKRSEIEPRVALSGADGRQGAVLQLGDVKQGDRASMSLEVVADHRSLSWLIVGLGLAAAYLFGFRDLVFKPRSQGIADK